jgi:hypothetical protein
MVIFVELWNEQLLERVQIHDTGNGRIHEEGAVRSFLGEGAKHVQISNSITSAHKETWIKRKPKFFKELLLLRTFCEIQRIFSNKQLDQRGK